MRLYCLRADVPRKVLHTPACASLEHGDRSPRGSCAFALGGSAGDGRMFGASARVPRRGG